MTRAAFILVLAASALYAQPTPPPAFEVASIRLHQGPVRNMADFSSSGPRITYGCFNAFQLVVEAYNLKNFQVSPGPKLQLDYKDYYEIAALAPGSAAVTRDEARRMLQSLLADRFKLQVHREPRELPVYELVVDKNGPALKAGSGDAPCHAFIGPVGRNYRYQLVNCPVERLADNLWADRPIVDKTGLTGLYDITLLATPYPMLRDSSDPGDISTGDAVRKIGLRLDAKKEQIEFLVVDHIEKPSQN